MLHTNLVKNIVQKINAYEYINKKYLSFLSVQLQFFFWGGGVNSRYINFKDGEKYINIFKLLMQNFLLNAWVKKILHSPLSFIFALLNQF